MTLNEAVRARVERVREPVWANKAAYLRLNYVNNGPTAAAHLFDRLTQEAIGEPTPQTFFVHLLDGGTVVESYLGPRDTADLPHLTD